MSLFKAVFLFSMFVGCRAWCEIPLTQTEFTGLTVHVRAIPELPKFSKQKNVEDSRLLKIGLHSWCSWDKVRNGVAPGSDVQVVQQKEIMSNGIVNYDIPGVYLKLLNQQGDGFDLYCEMGRYDGNTLEDVVDVIGNKYFEIQR